MSHMVEKNIDGVNNLHMISHCFINVDTAGSSNLDQIDRAVHIVEEIRHQLCDRGSRIIPMWV